MTRLTRDTSNELLGGVCSGLANHFELDPIIFRLLFVLITLCGGCGILMYLILWAVMPSK